MPPRHAYWTIIVDGQPTAFRAHDAEELLATLNRLKDKHPSAVMKWFERGKLWESRDAARRDGLGKGERRWEGPRPDRPQGPPRDRNWRPGGEHRDPHQKYKDAKKAKWNRYKQGIRDRVERGSAAEKSPADPRKFSAPHGDPLRPKMRPEGKSDRPGGWKPKGPPKSDRRWGDRDRRPWQGRERPRGDWRDSPPKDREPDWRGRPPRDRDRPEGAWRNSGSNRRFDDRHGGDRRGFNRKPHQVGGKKPDWRSGQDKPWASKASSGRSKAGGKPAGARGATNPGNQGRPRRSRKRRDDEES